MMPTKEDVHIACMNEIKNSVLAFQKILIDLKDGSQNDAKSSAGDKHETSISMMQIEQEKIGKQLKETEEMKNILEKIDARIPHIKIALGSLIKTNAGIFYIAVAIGRIKLQNQDIFVLSPQSPLGAKLLGLNLNDTIELNSKQFTINAIS